MLWSPLKQTHSESCERIIAWIVLLEKSCARPFLKVAVSRLARDPCGSAFIHSGSSCSSQFGSSCLFNADKDQILQFTKTCNKLPWTFFWSWKRRIRLLKSKNDGAGPNLFNKITITTNFLAFFVFSPGIRMEIEWCSMRIRIYSPAHTIFLLNK